MLGPESKGTGLSDLTTLVLAVLGFLLFVVIGRHFSNSWIFWRLFGP